MLGVGPGALPSDAFMLGIDPNNQREQMDEGLGAIIRLLTEREPITVDRLVVSVARCGAAIASAPARDCRWRRLDDLAVWNEMRGQVRRRRAFGWSYSGRRSAARSRRNGHSARVRRKSMATPSRATTGAS